jgi:protein gp37
MSARAYFGEPLELVSRRPGGARSRARRRPALVGERLDGVSIENKRWVEPADYLGRAAVRFISAEPLLGPR